MVLCLAGTASCAPALLEAQAHQELLRLAAAPGPLQLLAWAAAGHLASMSEAGAAALQEAGAIQVGLCGHMRCRAVQGTDFADVSHINHPK